MNNRGMKCLFLLFICLIGIPTVQAQNYQLLEEEAQKDTEREKIIEIRRKRIEEEQKKLLAVPISDDEIKNRQLVKVESNNVLPSDVSAANALVPYRIRRQKWGSQLTFTYSQYHPLNYESDYLDPSLGDFDDLYGSAQTNLMEIGWNYKRNFFLGSVGLESALSIYSNEAESDALNGSELNLEMLRLGLKYSADIITSEPYVVPYLSAGFYFVNYKEVQGNATLSGRTDPALYYSFGLLFQLNWLDPVAAVESYLESDVENTYVFVEGRQYFVSSQDLDPDFSTEMDINFGLTIEF
jgi:hypothetical protein